VTKVELDGAQLVAALRADGFDVTEWTDDAGATYDEHTHEHGEVRIVLAGAMTIIAGGVEHHLGPHDRIDLAPREPHAAQVHDDGVRYLAGSRR
jgi:quercetin dioxygenase-like cupin family protein